MIAKVNNISLFYEVSGSGDPLILLHGNGEDHHIFDALAKKLAADFTVYAVDSRNHGQSQKTENYAYETMAKDINSFIQVLDLKKVHLIGFSDGAIIGLMLAMAHEEVFKKIALLGVNLNPSDFKDDVMQKMKKAYEESKNPLLKLMLEQPDIKIDAVRHVHLPVFLTAAENDLFKPSLYTDLVDVFPNAELKIAAGHDHGSYIINNDLLYPDLIRFFNKCESDFSPLSTYH